MSGGERVLGATPAVRPITKPLGAENAPLISGIRHIPVPNPRRRLYALWVPQHPGGVKGSRREMPPKNVPCYSDKGRIFFICHSLPYFLPNDSAKRAQPDLVALTNQGLAIRQRLCKSVSLQITV